MTLTNEQKKLLHEHRCFKCKEKKTRGKILGPFGMVDSYTCKRCE